MRALVTLGLVGCVPPVMEVDGWGEVDGEHLLVDDPAEAYAERVQPIGRPAARLVPGGPLLDEVSPGLRDLVVADPTPWPRVITETGDVQVLVYVDRGGLETRVVARADGTGRDGEGRVRLRTGVVVERIDEDDDRVRITARPDLELEIDAWLPRSAVDEVWTDEPRTSLGEPVEGERRVLAEGASIVDRPAGDPLATIGAYTYGVTVTGDDDGGWVPVVLDETDVRVEGWAHVDDLDPRGGLVGRCGCRGGYGLRGIGRHVLSPARIVPAGTLLHAGSAGPVVGRTLRDVQVPVEDYDEGLDLERWTLLGRVSLWVAPEDVR